MYKLLDIEYRRNPMSDAYVNNELWYYILSIVSCIDSILNKGTKRFSMTDKLRAVIYINKIRTLAELYVIKIFEQLLIVFIKLPDKFLSLLTQKVSNTDGKNVNILYAHNGTSDITNKFKIFLKLYWEKGGLDSAHDSSGFDFRKLSSMLGCSMLYCCYLLEDKTAEMSPEKFFDNIKLFMIEQQENGNCYRTMDKKKKKLLMRHVDFDN